MLPMKKISNRGKQCKIYIHVWQWKRPDSLEDCFATFHLEIAMMSY